MRVPGERRGGGGGRFLARIFLLRDTGPRDHLNSDRNERELT